MVVAEDDGVQLKREQMGIDVGAKVALLDRHSNGARQRVGPLALYLDERLPPGDDHAASRNVVDASGRHEGTPLRRE